MTVPLTPIGFLLRSAAVYTDRLARSPMASAIPLVRLSAPDHDPPVLSITREDAEPWDAPRRRPRGMTAPCRAAGLVRA